MEASQVKAFIESNYEVESVEKEVRTVTGSNPLFSYEKEFYIVDGCSLDVTHFCRHYNTENLGHEIDVCIANSKAAAENGVMSFY